MDKREVCATMLTPYNNEGAVDIPTVRNLVDRCVQKGCSGIYSLSQDAEIFNLSLEERVELNGTVFGRAKAIESILKKQCTVFSSGHTADTIEEQAEELWAIAKSGTDALILLADRLDPKNEGDKVWIANAEKLLAKLPEEVVLGLDEGKGEHKRSISAEILQWCLSTGRFKYLLDNSCDFNTIDKRLFLAEESELEIYNTNAQTLLDSLCLGASGYCGSMANFHPQLYVWLCENFEANPDQSAFVQSILCTAAFSEDKLSYPLSAKYSMCIEGIKMNVTARSTGEHVFSDYEVSCVNQLKLFADVVAGGMLG